jgi:Site-specific recombinase XerD
MATIRKLPSGKFSAQIRGKNVRSYSKSFNTKAEAEAWAIAEADQGAQENASKLKMVDIARRYCDTQLKGKPSRHLMLDKLMRIAVHFPQPFKSITRMEINEYRLTRLSQVSGPTVREDLQAINKLFRWAEREMIFGDQPLNIPTRNIALPPPGKPRSRVIERAELDLLLSGLPPIMAEIVELAYETAMRRGEIIKLTPRVLHLEERCLSVIDGKTGDRIVPLTTNAIRLLKKAAARCVTSDSRLYPVASHSVSTALRRARNKVGLDDDVRLHQLRHTRISMVARKGFNQAQIMMVSGHRDSRSVQRYTHLNVRDVVELLD